MANDVFETHLPIYKKATLKLLRTLLEAKSLNMRMFDNRNHGTAPGMPLRSFFTVQLNIGWEVVRLYPQRHAGRTR